jgi:hypothetical protein
MVNSADYLIELGPFHSTQNVYFFLEKLVVIHRFSTTINEPIKKKIKNQ